MGASQLRPARRFLDDEARPAVEPNPVSRSRDTHGARAGPNPSGEVLRCISRACRCREKITGEDLADEPASSKSV